MENPGEFGGWDGSDGRSGPDIGRLKFPIATTMSVLLRAGYLLSNDGRRASSIDWQNRSLCRILIRDAG